MATQSGAAFGSPRFVVRRSIQARAESRDPGDLSTLDDPASLDEVRCALARGADTGS